MSIESSIQKNEFALKAKIESEKEQYYAIVNQYQKKIESLNDAYNQLKTDREKELKNTEQFHEKNMSKVNNQFQELEMTAQNDLKKFQK